MTTTATDKVDGYYGLVCRGGPSGNLKAKAYFFALEGQNAVIKKIRYYGNNFSITNLINSGYVPTANNANNLLQASCVTDHSKVDLTFWINGRKVASYIDSTNPYMSGFVGIFAATAGGQAGLTVAFQNFGAYHK